jgi:hypothetical protein
MQRNVLSMQLEMASTKGRLDHAQSVPSHFSLPDYVQVRTPRSHPSPAALHACHEPSPAPG